uniref:PH domain-containing protein n=1 Tax=Palpitomonas bilix TaxID=652834 RepID=A0A7S3CY22_9EUKA
MGGVENFCRVMKHSLYDDEMPQFEKTLKETHTKVQKVVAVNASLSGEAKKLGEQCHKFSANITRFLSNLEQWKELLDSGNPLVSVITDYEHALSGVGSMCATIGECMSDTFSRQIGDFQRGIASETAKKQKQYESAKERVSQALVKLVSIKKKEADADRLAQHKAELEKVRHQLLQDSFDYYHTLSSSLSRQQFEVFAQVQAPLRVQASMQEGIEERTRRAMKRMDVLHPTCDGMVCDFADSEVAISEMKAMWEKGKEGARHAVKKYGAPRSKKAVSPSSSSTSARTQPAERSSDSAMPTTSPNKSVGSTGANEGGHIQEGEEGKEKAERGSISSLLNAAAGSDKGSIEGGKGEGVSTTAKVSGKEGRKQAEKEGDMMGKRGYLFMQTRGFGGKRKHWKRRWFEVGKNVLRIYRRFPQQDDTTAFKSELSLSNTVLSISDMSDRLHCFTLTGGEKDRIISLQAESHELMFAWMRSLVLNGCKDSTTTAPTPAGGSGGGEGGRGSGPSSLSPLVIPAGADGGGGGRSEGVEKGKAEASSLPAHVQVGGALQLGEIEQDADWWLYATEEEVEEHYASHSVDGDLYSLLRSPLKRREEGGSGREKDGRRVKSMQLDSGVVSEMGREEEGGKGRKREREGEEKRTEEGEKVRDEAVGEYLDEINLRKKANFSNLLFLSFEDIHQMFKPSCDGLAPDIYDTLQVISRGKERSRSVAAIK